MSRPAKYRGTRLPSTDVNRCPVSGRLHRWAPGSRVVLGPEWHLLTCQLCSQTAAVGQNQPRKLT